MMSSMLRISYLRQVSAMPPDSSWNTPIVSPRLSRAKVSGSSSGTCADVELRDLRGGCGRTASWITVRFRRPEEVHLEHADLGDGAHVELGDHFAFVAAGERHVLVERSVADDHAGGMRRRRCGRVLRA